MKLLTEIAFRGMDGDVRLKQLIDHHIRRLNHVADGLMSCRVAIERRPRPIRSGAPYHVRVEVKMAPDGDLVVRKSGDAVRTEAIPATTVLKDAFQAMERRVREETERRRYHIKSHDVPRAFVERVFPEEGYGFVRTEDGEEVYVHRNAVLHRGFDRLRPGTAVRIAAARGRKGPQASSVEIIDKPGVRAGLTEPPEQGDDE
jgi:cold shock CspA family protein